MENEIKNTIKKSLKEKGITEEEFARILKLDLSFVIGIELGVKYPTVNTLKLMCSILEKSADELYTGIQKSPLSLEGLTEDQKRKVRDIYLEFKK